MGWAVNPNYNYIPPGQLGRILTTSDGGKTWRVLKDSSISFYRSVGFADSLTGWAGNLYAETPADTFILNETTDGGATWHQAHISQPHPAGVCGISVVTDSVVFAYGTYYGPAAYMKTTNKGATWTYKDMSSIAGGLIDGYFFNKDTGFVTGHGTDLQAAIFYTTDGGDNWQTVYHSTRTDTDHVWKISFPSRNIGYGSVEYVGSNYTSFNSVFVKTTDGGLTWTEHPFVPNYNEEGIGFINDTVGWIGGDNVLPCYKTTDGGNTFAPDAGFGVMTPPYQDYGTFFATGFAVNRFRRFGDTLMYACGNTVYKLNTADQTGVNDMVNTAGIKTGNYPNPFNTETVIHYNLPHTANKVTLEIYNASGQTVFTKDLGMQQAGDEQYTFKTTLAPGTYYYSITTEKFTSTKAMVVIR